MKINVKSIFFFLLFTLLLIPSQLSAQENEPARIDSTQLKQTTVTSYMQEAITPGKNILYCSTFQIAWNQLIDDIIKEPLQLTDNPVIAQMLNQRLTGKEDISEDCYIAMAGLKKDGIVDEINKDLKEKFNTATGIDINLERPGDILVYAFLFKDLKFEKEFENLNEPIMFNDKTAVRAFGIKKYSPGIKELPEIPGFKNPSNSELGKQMGVLDYISDNDFIIGLKSKSLKNEIILAKVNPGKTLLETITTVFGRIANVAPSLLEPGESLQIPKIDFNILHNYQELEDKLCLNNGLKDYSIIRAIQSIRFRLDEKGALLKSEAAIMLGGMPRNYIFNKPFLLCLREKGAKYPYFAMWVDNAELLLKE